MIPRQVGILLFNEVEVLDFAGPFEVFSLTENEQREKCFRVTTLSQDGKPVSARNGLRVEPAAAIGEAPQLDILVIPGGFGAEEIEIHNRILLDWIARRASDTPVVASVCTGAFLLAEAGLLDGRSATTHWMDLDRLENEYPRISVKRGVKFVDDGPILTSGGISAGIVMSLHLVGRICGSQIAANTARRMEFDHHPENPVLEDSL